MDEILLFYVSMVLSLVFLRNWYRSLFALWPLNHRGIERAALGVLPVFSLLIILYTLLALASFDVVDSPVYIILYIVFGFAWLYLGTLIMSGLFDLSWRDDILGGGNKAALFSFLGGFLAATLIYSGANIGDGPGWWCVAFAGGLGMVAWAALALLFDRATQVFERVTVGRDVACGIRLGCFLLAGGLLFGRASAGDWTSASMTVVEFGAGWPVLPLAVLATAIERAHINASKKENAAIMPLSVSVFVGLLFLAIAVFSVILLPPLPEALINE